MVASKTIGTVKRYFVKGFIVLIPALLTIVLLSIALGFVSNAISPITDTIEAVLNINNLPEYAVDAIAIGVLLLVILLVGILSEILPTAKQLTDLMHAVVESIPGVGGVYGSVRKMSETMVQGKNSFRDVKLVEYPSENSYSIAFVTAGENPTIANAVGESTITLFIPIAPNPLMGGMIVNLPEDRVHEVDISVREGMKAVITSGVTLSAGGTDESIELEEELNELEQMITDEEENKAVVQQEAENS